MKSVPSIRIYALAVCFVSVICIAITSGFALYNFLKLAAPDLTIEPYRIQYLASNDAFVNNPGAYPRPVPIGADRFNRALENSDPFAGMSDQDITRLRQQRLQNEYDLHRRSAMQSLLRQAIIILVSTLLYAVHWRLAKTIGAGLIADEDN